MIDSYVHEEHEYDRDRKSGMCVSRPTGLYSIVISGLSATQLAVIEGALANLLVLEGGDQDRGQEATEERGQPALET